ncbi:hypothetical protein HY214_00680 [Candidatus Roizmanbacteria bacterium]|nr:hypothetical protein [Candidatus Roizmanbacteria bacterium]
MKQKKDGRKSLFTKNVRVKRHPKELFQFVSFQFEELAKKNIRIPIKLFHL